jgi:4-hydroxybutyryl-CoA dehydratase/vinylacetyl-CoA-Delta-isomerase
MEMDWGLQEYGGTEALVIFDDVFVPWERVFLNGEWDYTPQLMETFANFHRVLYAAKSCLGDLAIGAAAQIAEYNGVEHVHHIRSKLAEMIVLNETLYCLGLAAAFNGVPTPSGVWCDHPVLSNVVKANVIKNMYEICRLAEDIAGGLLTTQPSEKDWRNPKLKPYIEKYLKGADGYPTEHRMRMFKLLESLTYGQISNYARLEAMHGAGSPEAQKVFIRRYYDIEELKKLARGAAHIEKDAFKHLWKL